MAVYWAMGYNGRLGEQAHKVCNILGDSTMHLKNTIIYTFEFHLQLV